MCGCPFLIERGVMMKIDLEVKQRCVELANQGKTSKEIYNDFFSKQHNGQSYASFRKSLQKWKKKIFADSFTLHSGTYEGFVPHNATVQVDSNGNVIQCWIKQTAEQYNLEKIIDNLKELPKVEYIEPIKTEEPDGMLEISLFDVHFGIADIEYYKETINRILLLISSKKWECIQVIIGQDLFHNDDFRGRTAKGTPIQQVDMEKAYADARQMYFSILRKAKQCCDDVQVHYSEGNHDETTGWFFFEMLKEVFGEQLTFDDSRKPRKCIHWNDIFIGYGHCDDGRTSPKDIRCQFTIEFPIEFAHSKTREIHLGHMHTEIKDGDESGVIVRRLATGNKTDGWHDKNGYVGNHKRFQVFEYSHDRLTSIHYV